MQRHKHHAWVNAFINGRIIEASHIDNPVGEGWIVVEGLHVFDLDDFTFRVQPKIIEKTGWVNIYSEKSVVRGTTYNLSDSKEQADAKAMPNRVACIRVTWTEEV